MLDEIARRLTWSGQLNAAGINVNVKDGEVTLSGTVNSRKDKRLAEDIVDSVGGVVDVHNELMIKQQQSNPQSQQH
jgi:osmotically-inducible protein OsmY